MSKFTEILIKGCVMNIHKNDFDGQLKFGARLFNSSTNRIGTNRPSSDYIPIELKKIISQTADGSYVRKAVGDWSEIDHCPVCESRKRTFFVERFGLSFYQCQNCEHVYQSPIVDEKKAIELYSSDQTGFDIYTSASQRQLDIIKYDYGIQVLRDIKPDLGSRILDIGCGGGLFLERAAASGFSSLVGIDANHLYSDGYKSKNNILFFNTDFGSLDYLHEFAPFDVVSLWGVFEHLYDPRKMLESIKAISHPDTLLLILVPNVKSLATRLIRAGSPCFNWKHLHYFHAGSLREMLSRHGYVDRHIETVITEIGSIKNYMAGLHPYKGSHTDRDIEFPFITPEFIHGNFLGSRLFSIFSLDN